MNKTIISKAPLRLGSAAGTDLPLFSKLFGGCVLT